MLIWDFIRTFVIVNQILNLIPKSWNMALKIMKLYRFTALNFSPFSHYQEDIQFSTIDVAIIHAKSLLSHFCFVMVHEFDSMDSCGVLVPIAKLENGFDIEYYPAYYD